MTPQERQLIDDLFERLSGLESTPRDAEAAAAIAQGQRRAPNGIYALVQTVLVQDEALKRAHARIQDLESGGVPADQNSGGGFLDTMRDKLFGQTPPRSSVPSSGGRATWNGGQAMGQPQDRYAPQQGQPMQQPYAQPMGGGGSFLGTAAAAAAGAIGGGLLMNSMRGMMGGGNHQSFGDSPFGGDRGNSAGGGSSNNELARDAGVNDVGKDSGSSGRSGDDSRSGFFDNASNDDTDSDDGDFDGGYDDGGDSDSA